jgi:nucleotide-binding universal stress UspA family protein
MNKLTSSALTALLLGLSAGCLHAQSSCSSDGQPRPAALLERFINADCEACWSDSHSPQPAAGELALDWIVPAARGDDAPLSAAATRDALARLQALRRAVPAKSDSARHQVGRGARELRVAHGLAFNGYIGTSIELKPGSGGPWQAWLLLVETIPAGSEGTPVARNLVRNALQPAWDGGYALSKQELQRLFESRPMSIPEGAKPARLRVVGWVEDARGRIRAIAQSRCQAPGPKG